jgi:hypothetical protein
MLVCSNDAERVADIILVERPELSALDLAVHDDVLSFGKADPCEEIRDFLLLPQADWLHDDLAQGEEVRSTTHKFDYLINFAERGAILAFWIDVVYTSIIR